MQERKKIIIANWKMNPQTLSEAERWLIQFSHDCRTIDLKKIDLVIAPPFVYLEALKSRLPKSVGLGAQNISWLERGALTGEISGAMLKNLGCEYVIIGHSERRWQLGETDEMINLKLKTALSLHIKPILAVGEKSKGDDPRAILQKQITSAFKDLNALSAKEIIVAYEPVWAIGTGVADTPDDALSASLIIRKIMSNIYSSDWAFDLSIIYGGSVSEKNVSDFVNQEGIDGALIGSASLDASGFSRLVKQIL